MNTSKDSAKAWSRHAYVYPQSFLNGLPENALVNSLDFFRTGTGMLRGAPDLKMYLANASDTLMNFGAAALDFDDLLTLYNAVEIFNGDPTTNVDDTIGFKNFPTKTPFKYTGGALLLFTEYAQNQTVTSDVLWRVGTSYPTHSSKYSSNYNGNFGNTTLQGSASPHPFIQINYSEPICTDLPLKLPYTEGFETANYGCLKFQTYKDTTLTNKISPILRRVAQGKSPIVTPFCGKEMLKFNSNEADSSSKVRLVLPTFNTTGVPSVDLSFALFESDSLGFEDNRDSIAVEYSLDGKFWSSISEANCVRTNPLKGWQNRTFTLPDSVGNKAKIYISLLFTAKGGLPMYLDSLQVVPTPSVKDSGDCSQAVILRSVAGWNWYRLSSLDGKTIAEINPRGNNLGDISALLFVQQGDVRTNLGKPYLNRNIEITPTIQPTTPVDVRIFYRASEFDALKKTGTLTTEKQLIVARVSDNASGLCSPAFSGTPAAIITPKAGGNYAADKYIRFETTGFSQFFFNGTEAALPIELLDFQGKTFKKTNVLAWTTASEINVKVFVIERSSDGLHDWRIINTTIPQGSKTRGSQYKTTDFSPLSLGYYRLQSVDKDGSTSISKTISLVRSSAAFALKNVFPVPTDDAVTVTVGSPKSGQVQVSIVDMIGRVMVSKTVRIVEGETSIPMEMMDFPSGFYWLNIDNGAERLVKKIVKK